MHFWNVAAIVLGGTVALGTATATAQDYDTEDMVAAVTELFGHHKGYRAVHAKGFCGEGSFQATPAAADISKASLFSGETVPVMFRYSLTPGLPGRLGFEREDQVAGRPIHAFGRRYDGPPDAQRAHGVHGRSRRLRGLLPGDRSRPRDRQTRSRCVQGLLRRASGKSAFPGLHGDGAGPMPAMQKRPITPFTPSTSPMQMANASRRAGWSSRLPA